VNEFSAFSWRLGFEITIIVLIGYMSGVNASKLKLFCYPGTKGFQAGANNNLIPFFGMLLCQL